VADQQANDAALQVAVKPPSKESGRWGRWEEQTKFWTALIGLIAAVVVGAVGVFAAVQVQRKDEATTTSQSLQVQLDDRNRDIGNLRSNNNELQQKLAEANSDNQKLQSANSEQAQKLKALQAATGTSGTSPTGSTTSAANDPAIRNKGVVGLASGKEGIDLDASNSPDWHRYFYQSTTNQLYVYGSNLSFTNTQVLKREGEPATYATCSAVKAYDARSAIPLSELSVNSFLCGRITGSGRIAAMRITSLDTNSITLDITTWENQ
jgi:uncharacterized membrane-anchored protein YhcB (DUF1043 family)